MRHSASAQTHRVPVHIDYALGNFNPSQVATDGMVMQIKKTNLAHAAKLTRAGWHITNVFVVSTVFPYPANEPCTT
jgi:hypothetical protein